MERRKRRRGLKNPYLVLIGNIVSFSHKIKGSVNVNISDSTFVRALISWFFYSKIDNFQLEFLFKSDFFQRQHRKYTEFLLF